MKAITQSIISAALFSGLLTTPVMAKKNDPETSSTTNKTPATQATKTAKKSPTTDVDVKNKEAIRKKEKTENELLKTVNKGIAEGLDHVLKATKLIEEGKDKEAIKSLQVATGKFDIALAADPKLKLIPIESHVVVEELIISSSQVKKEVTRAEKLLKESKVQEARAVLLPLKDELVTSVTYLPMQTYPLSIKLATKLLIEGKRNAALDTLALALTTVVTEETITPLPIVRAESLVQMASKADKEKEKKQIHSLLKAAQEQLKKAIALGYTSKSDQSYEEIYQQIESLQKEIDDENKVEPLYKKIIDSIKKLVN